jgi:cytochrome oxidase Cu insertion factor (SCO1/SenC/PrrC family)
MRAIAVLASVLLAIAAAGCGESNEDAATETMSTAASTEPTAPARQAPDVEGVTLDGKRLSLADLRGRPVFVNVWAAW